MTAPSSSTDTLQTQPPQRPNNYPHMEILRTLQTTSRQSLQNSRNTTTTTAADDDDDDRDLPNNDIPSWNLSTDAQLATFLREFSTHIVHRTEEVSLTIRALQEGVDRAGLHVANVAREFGDVGEHYFLEQVVGHDEDDEEEVEEEEGDDGDDGDEEDDDSDSDESESDTKPTSETTPHEKPPPGDDDSAASIARLEAEEKSAILNGMVGLSLFYDPQRRPPQRAKGGTAADLTVSGEEDIIGDHSYYYHCAEGDGFNERALPFIVGSREFMESCGGVTSGGQGV